MLDFSASIAIVTVKPHVSHYVFFSARIFGIIHIENLTWFRFVCTFVPLFGMHSFSLFRSLLLFVCVFPSVVLPTINDYMAEIVAYKSVWSGPDE